MKSSFWTFAGRNQGWLSCSGALWHTWIQLLQPGVGGTHSSLEGIRDGAKQICITAALAIAIMAQIRGSDSHTQLGNYQPHPSPWHVELLRFQPPQVGSSTLCAAAVCFGATHTSGSVRMGNAVCMKAGTCQEHVAQPAVGGEFMTQNPG